MAMAMAAAAAAAVQLAKIVPATECSTGITPPDCVCGRRRRRVRSIQRPMADRHRR